MDEFDEYGNPIETAPEPQQDGPKQLRENFTRVSEQNKALKRENALLKAGLGDLPEVKQKALLAAHDGDLTAEAVRKTAVDLGFAAPPEPVTTEPDPAEKAAEGAERVAAAANGAGSVERGAITPTDVATWSQDRQRRFMSDHPDAWELLKRGESVTGIAHF